MPNYQQPRTGNGNSNPFIQNGLDSGAKTSSLGKTKSSSTAFHEVTEHSEQVLLINWVRGNQSSDPRLVLLYAIPNGGSRNIATAQRLKHEGVLSGVPDLCLPVPVGQYHGLYIELKTLKGKASDKQKRYIQSLNNQGYLAIVCQGHQEAIMAIKKYLGEGENAASTVC